MLSVELGRFRALPIVTLDWVILDEGLKFRDIEIDPLRASRDLARNAMNGPPVCISFEQDSAGGFRT